MTPAQALHAATLSAARLTGLDGELGTLEPGKVADLVIADGDALDVHDLGDRVCAGRLRLARPDSPLRPRSTPRTAAAVGVRCRG
jgi:cytosine/adenosine deaminase-related metal-dependent hydrolase